jgi:hypothetical protein
LALAGRAGCVSKLGKTLPPPAWTLVGVGSRRKSLSVSLRSEGTMIKRRKRAPGGRQGWAKRLAAMIAGIGGVAGGLLFWRKRKAS